MRPGKCFRLTTQAVFGRDLPQVTVPEMQRSDLTGMVLQVCGKGGEGGREGGSWCCRCVRVGGWGRVCGRDEALRLD